MFSKKEFDFRKELLGIEHRFKMEEIEFRFQRELELQRIKSAEIRKNVERRNY